MLVGGYTGGSLNFLAVSQAVGMEPTLGTAALAAETLAGVSYLFALAVLPTVAAVRRWLPLRGPETGAAGGSAAGGGGPQIRPGGAARTRPLEAAARERPMSRVRGPTGSHTSRPPWA